MAYPNRLRRRQAARQQQESIDMHMDDYMEAFSEVSEDMIPPMDAPTGEDAVDMLDLHHSSPTEGHVGTSAEGALVNSDLPRRNVTPQTNPPHADHGNIRDKGKSIIEDSDQEDAPLPIPVPVLVPAPPPVPPTSTKKKCNPYSPCAGCLSFFGTPVPGRLRIRGPLLDDDDLPPRRKSKQSRHGPVSKSSEFRGVTFYKRTGRWESHIWHGARQVYLGASRTKEEAARGYDKAALYLNGPVTRDMNFPRYNYQEEMLRLRELTKNQLVIYLRRLSRGFATDAKYPCIKVVRNGYMAMYKPDRKKRASMALGRYDTEEDAARAVYNEALKRQNGDLAGYLMDTHHVYSTLPPSAARPPRGAAGPEEDHHAPQARDVDDDAPEGCDDDNSPSEANKRKKAPCTEATDSNRKRVARPRPTANDAPAPDPVQSAAAPNPEALPPPEFTGGATPQPHGRLPVVVPSCPRKLRSSRRNVKVNTSNTTVGAGTTPVMAAPIAPIRRNADIPISVSTPDLLPAPHQAAVPVQQVELQPAASLPQSTAMERPVHPVQPLVQQYSVATSSGIAPGSKQSACRCVVGPQAPAAQRTGTPGNSRTPPAAAEASTLKPGRVGVDPEPKSVHPRPPRPHVTRAGRTVTASVPLGARMQPASSVHQLAAPAEPTQNPTAASVHQSVAVDTLRWAASVEFETMTVPAWHADSQNSNDERPQLEVSMRPQAVVERNVGVIPTSTLSSPSLPCPQEAFVPAQPANESLREPVSFTASQASEWQFTLPAARRPPISEYLLHQSIAGIVRRPSAALQTIIPVRHAQNLNVQRPQMESLTRPQPVIGAYVGDNNLTSMANTRVPAPNHESPPSQPPNSLQQSLLPASTAPQAASSGMPSSRHAPRRRQPVKAKRPPRPLAPKCRAPGDLKARPSLLPPHSRPPAVSTHIEASTSPRDAQRNVGTVPISTQVPPPPPALQPASVLQFPEPIVAPFRPYARQNIPYPVQRAYSSVQQPAPLDCSFDASGSGRQILSPGPSPRAEYNSEWQPVRPAILDTPSTDQATGGIHRQRDIVPEQSVLPHVRTISPEMITGPGNLSYNSEGRRAVQELQLGAAAAAISCDCGRAHHDDICTNGLPLQAHYNSWTPNLTYTQATRPTPMRLQVLPSEEFNGNLGHYPTASPETIGNSLQPAPTRGFQPYGWSRFTPPAQVRPPEFSVMDWYNVEEMHATTIGLSRRLIPDQTSTRRDEETSVHLQNDLPVTELQVAAPSIAGRTLGADDNVNIDTADRLTWLSL